MRRLITLSATHRQLSPPASDVRRVLVQLSDGGSPNWVTITRTGSFTDPRYGRFEITLAMLESMVRNFDAKVVGQDVFIDVDHRPGDGAAARILALAVEGNRLRAKVEWTEFGKAAVKDRGFRYLSAEYDERWKDNEQGKDYGPTLLGAGLTVRPVIKRLDPVQLAQDPRSNAPVLLHPELLRQLTHDSEDTRMNRIEKLRRKLLARGLSQVQVDAIIAAYEASAKALAEDANTEHDALIEAFDASGKQLAEAIAAGATGNGAPITLSVQAGGLTADDVKKLLAEQQTAAATTAKKLAEDLAANQATFAKALAEHKGLSDETRKELAKGAAVINADMAEGQVKALAEHYCALGDRIEAARQLAAMGLGVGPAGQVHISVDESNGIRKLASEIRGHLRNTASAGNGQIRAVEDETKLPRFVQRVLSEFDRNNAHRLHDEAKALSGGVVNIGDTSLPASFTREVIVETLADLRILELVDADVDPTTSATHNVPYETRGVSAVYNNGIVYEGQAIHQGGVSQANFLAYIVPTKIAMEVTNEVMHFSRANANINWDAWGRNIASNSRLARELIARRLMNELQRSADAYGAVAVTGEAFDSQLTGSASVLKTTYFPIVRPFQARDLQGTAIGSVENAITITLNGVAITEYDGTGTQSAGTYWRVTNYNLGYIQLVNQLGVAVTPADSGTNTLAYSRVTNVVKVDLDIVSGSTYEKQMNKLLQGVGSRKAALSQDAFVKADFALVSETLHNSITDAENFASGFRRDGTNTTPMGDLAEVKGIPVWGTNTDADLGDERLILGQRGTLKYRIAKTFAIGAPFEIFNSSGKPLGKKGAYGEEYSSICVPTPLRNRVTSMLGYSVTGR